jgi:hypothetical protein
MFTTNDLLKSMKLSIGDKIKLNGIVYTITTIDNKIVCKSDTTTKKLSTFIDTDYVKLSTVGDTMCEGNCEKCPLYAICLCDGYIDTLYNILNSYEIKQYDREIYDILINRLNKEIE